MFWKKKDKKEKEENRPLIKVPADNRQAYRIAPMMDEPIVLDLDGKTADAVDISSGGFSFKNMGFKGGERFKVNFTLPISMEEIRGLCEVVRIGKNELCHARFINLDRDMENKIHKYVLDRQKEDLHL